MTRYLQLTILIAVWIASPARGDEPARITSPEALWQGFNPETEPLEIESLRVWEEGPGIYEKLRFTGETVGDAEVRVFAIQGAPKDAERCPGILHIHGGGQTASLAWVQFWVERGYACVSFDFCGELPPRTEFTDWGPLKHGNMMHAAGGFQLRPSTRESSWYHWALVSRRALTLLASHPKVDRKRLGIFGISVGGSLTWMVAGFDNRVKAAVPIYGCGYNYDRGNMRWGYPAPSDELREFQRVLSPEAHAPFVTAPTFFLDATNDFHGFIDRAFETIDATAADTRQAFTPRYNHHIHPDQGRNLPLWMDWHLKDGDPLPGNPRMSIELDVDGVPTALVRPAEPDDVRSVDVFYALGDKRPPIRFWRSARTEKSEGAWRASLPIVDVWDDLRTFANVTYESGACLSTRLKTIIPAQIGRAHATLTPSTRLAHKETGMGHWYFTNGYTDPNIDKTYLVADDDPAVGPFVSFNLETFGDPIEIRISSHLIGDPQFAAPEEAELVLMSAGAFVDKSYKITLIVDDWGPRPLKYTATVKQAEPGWSETVLSRARFVDTEGRPLEHWKGIDKIEIEGRGMRSDPPKFATFGWRTARNR